MIHRVDRVNPDVDDRVIKPNEARMAVNLRFGASTDDTNLSGGTLVLGNKELSFTPPAGTNKVVGVYADLESRNVFFALYNGENNHGLYRINGATDVVEPIARGPWLRFQGGDDYNVSITGVDGKLYWTDNVEQPKVINVEKGIRTILNPTGPDVYPIEPEDWFYTQIKRPPGQALEVSPVLSTADASITFNNKTLTNTGLQYSYYYVYDNFEESRLAPFTFNSFAVYNVTIRIPDAEYNAYTTKSSLIKKVVIVVRNGNDGVWRELQYQDNVLSPRQLWVFPNVLTAVKNTVAADITDARFDSVPLRSKTNEIAQNKINHANYRIDYEYDNAISVKAAIKTIGSIIEEGSNFPIGDLNSYLFNSFLPWGRYTIGVELVDKYGRTYPVTNAVDVVAPFLEQQFVTRSNNLYSPGDQIQLSTGNNLFDVTVNKYSQSGTYSTVAEYEVSGNLPAWVDRVNIVRSKAKNIITMHQSIGQMLMWYETDRQSPRFFNWVYPQLTAYTIPDTERTRNVNVIYNAGETNNQFTFKGFAIKYPSDAPFLQTDNLYITIYRPTYAAGAVNFANPSQSVADEQNDAGVYAQVLKFKVHLIADGLIYIKTGEEIQKSEGFPASLPTNSGLYLTPWSFPVAVFDPTVNDVSATNDPAKWYPLLWNFTLTQETNVDDQIVYTTQDTYSRVEYESQITANGAVKGWLKGDGSIARIRKTFPTTGSDVKLYVFPGTSGAQQPAIIDKALVVGSFNWEGNFISMSPRDIYAQEWNQNIGQLNTVNYKDARNRELPSNICFSGNIIQGTQVNGLNKFNSLDFRQAPSENGPITSLVTTNATQREPGVLLAIGTYGISSFYYDAIQLTNVDGTNNVTTTDSYLASQRPLVGQYGTTRPMSVTKTPLGTVYWWSDVVNDLIRYTNAGLERLGNTFSFANYLRRKFDDNPLLITWYDQVTDEINLLGRNRDTAVFSERYKTFQGEREYWQAGRGGALYPERAIGIPTKQYWFINGRIYVSDVSQSPASVPPNFLFGAFKDPKVSLVTNETPSVVKRWNQVKVFGNRPTEVILTAPIDNGGELTSLIFPPFFINRKGDWEAAIRRASNTEGGLLAGKLMESRIIYSNFAFSAEGFDKLNFIEVKSNVSIVQ
jgi:hypothetical protein